MTLFESILKRVTHIHSICEGLVERKWNGLRGEWWIMDGHCNFADGDVSDMGHEEYAIQSVTSDILAELGIEDEGYDGEHVLLSDYYDEVSEAIGGFTGGDVRSCLVEYLMKNASPEIAKDAWEAVRIAWSGEGDARVWVMKRKGWQRVADDTVETWTLTDADLRHIYTGLNDILEEEGVDDDADPEFDIYVVSGNKWFTGVPLSAMNEGTSGLRGYDSSFAAR